MGAHVHREHQTETVPRGGQDEHRSGNADRCNRHQSREGCVPEERICEARQSAERASDDQHPLGHQLREAGASGRSISRIAILKA